MTIRTEERASQAWDDDGGRTPSKPGDSSATSPPDYFVAKEFRIPEMKGISARNVREHLELYKGYVKFSNHIVNRIRELSKDDTNLYEVSLLERRLAYELDGMTHHEMFFEQFVGGPGACVEGGPFLKQVAKDFGGFETLVGCLKNVAMTRGVGWAMLYSCPDTGHLIPHWVDEHHVGLLSGPRLILALDMWEHAFVYDYPTSEKSQYVEALFQNLSWIKVESRFGK